MDTMLITIPDAAAQLAISRSKAYQLVASGDLRVVRIGRSARIRREDLAAWVSAQLEPTDGSARRSVSPWDLQ